MHNKPRVSRDPQPVRCFIEKLLRYRDAVVHLQIPSSQARILRVYVPGIKEPSPQIKHYKNRLYKSTGRFRVFLWTLWVCAFWKVRLSVRRIQEYPSSLWCRLDELDSSTSMHTNIAINMHSGAREPISPRWGVKTETLSTDKSASYTHFANITSSILLMSLKIDLSMTLPWYWVTGPRSNKAFVFLSSHY